MTAGAQTAPVTETTPNPSNSTTTARPCGGSRSTHVERRAPSISAAIVDGYYSYNVNRPGQDSALGQVESALQLRRPADQFSLEAAKLTLNHDPDPIGAHVDLHVRTHQRLPASRVTACRARRQLHRAGIRQHQAGKGEGLRAGLRPVCDVGRPGSDRDDEQLELLARHSVRLRDSLLPLRTAHLHAGDQVRGPLACSW